MVDRTITLTVEEGPHKPYCLKSKAYKRNDTSTVEVDRLEFDRLVLAGQNLSYDKTPAHTDGLTFKTLGAQVEEKLGINEINDDVLKTLELESPRGEFNVAAELLADINSFPGIDCAVRVTRDLIPEAAFREAIANSLVHRQWDVSAHIRVAMFGNRVEITSPGGLPQGLSEREYLDSQTSILRNPILGNVFFRLDLIEWFGTGVLRIKECYRQSAAQPIFDIYENSIKVTLPVIQSTADLAEGEAAIFNIVSGRTLPTSEITSLSGFSRSKVQAITKRLVERGYLSVVGSGRGTKHRA